ncbi:acyltransferase [Diplocloster modestus]|nr:acyltransferase [Diplocloster modestus]
MISLRTEYNRYKTRKNMQLLDDCYQMGQGNIIKPGFMLDIRCPHPNGKCFLDIGEHNVLRGRINIENKNGFVHIGNGCNIGDSCMINSITGVTIHNQVMISWNVTIYDHNAHSTNSREREQDIRSIYEREISKDNNAVQNWRDHIKDWSVVKSAPVVIHDNVWIGFGCIILKGVTIGEGAVIGAGSIVTHDIPPYTIAAGNPAVLVGKTN